MAFLTIAGTTIPVTPSGATENAVEEVGSESRSYNGALRSTIRAEKRSWSFTTKGLTLATLEALRTSVALGAQVTCTGTALNNVSYTCRVRIGSVTMFPIRGGFKCSVQLTLRQV